MEQLPSAALAAMAAKARRVPERPLFDRIALLLQGGYRFFHRHIRQTAAAGQHSECARAATINQRLRFGLSGSFNSVHQVKRII